MRAARRSWSCFEPSDGWHRFAFDGIVDALVVGPPGQFRVDVRTENGALVVSPQGEIDLGTVEEVRLAIDRAHDGVAPLVIDLGGVGFLDTSGLRLVVEQNNRARDLGYGLELLPGPPPVQRVFQIAGLEPKLPFRGAAGAADPGA